MIITTVTAAPSGKVASVDITGGTQNITLKDVNMEVSGCAFSIAAGAAVNLTLEGTNGLKSGGYYAGINVPASTISTVPDASLTITAASTGSLTLIGGDSGGAGIGGNGIQGSWVINGTAGAGTGEAGGIITINGGTITATGSFGGAGIGGGFGQGGYAISGSGTGGAGTGGAGTGGAGGTITINGGMITATGGNYGGSGIGGGYGHGGLADIGNGGAGTGGVGGTTTINGGTIVAAAGNYGGAGIGGGYGEGGMADFGIGGMGGTGMGGAGTGGAGGTTTINEGTVTATGSDYGGAGIGGSNGSGYMTAYYMTSGTGTGGAGGTVMINGGMIQAATGGIFAAAAIGGGNESGGNGSSIGAGATNIFKGGSIVSTGPVTTINQVPTNGTDTVYKTTISVLPVSTEVSYTVDGGSAIPSSTDASGNLYLWLPVKSGSDETSLLIKTATGYYLADVTVTSGGGSATVTQEPYLQDLTVSNGTILPTYSPIVTNYTMEVANSVTSLMVTPTAYNASTSIKVNNISVASGCASNAIALAVGSNTIVVTSSIGSSMVNYTITITRASVATVELDSSSPDSAVTVSYFTGNADTATDTDTVAIKTTSASNEATVFTAGDFLIKDGSSNTANTLTGVSVTGIGSSTAGSTTLTLQVQKNVTATAGYLWYKSTCVGSLTIDKTVRNPNLLSIMPVSAIPGAANGSPKTEAGLGLPTAVNIVTEDSTITTAGVTWDMASVTDTMYDPSVLTAQTFTVNGTVNLPAGVDNGNSVSLSVSVSVTVVAGGTAAAPTADIPAGTYTVAQSVTLSNATPGSEIHYTTDGSVPGAASPLYTGPITVASGITINAIAIAPGMLDSSVASFSYVIHYPAVTSVSVTPASTTVEKGSTQVFLASVTVEYGADATVTWTVDGNTSAATTISKEGVLVVGSDETADSLTVKAMATADTTKTGEAAVTVVKAVAAPTVSLPEGSYIGTQSVSLSTGTDSAAVYYTTNGDDPVTAGTLYKDLIIVNQSMTIKAVAIKSGMQNSPMTSVSYTIQDYAAADSTAATTAASTAATSSTTTTTNKKAVKQLTENDVDSAAENEDDTANNSDTPAVSGEEPYLTGADGVKGWDSIINEINDKTASATGSATIEVNMSGATTVTKEVLQAIQGKDVDLILDMGNGISWTINGKSLMDVELSDLNLGIHENTENIPVDIINSITGEKSTMQISLDYSGEFGFAITMNINLNAENAGYFANLYYYNPDTSTMDFVTSNKIDESGNAEIGFTHASDYAIVISEKNLNPNNSAAVENKISEGKKSKERNPIYLYVIAIVGGIAIIGGGAAYVIKKRKK